MSENPKTSISPDEILWRFRNYGTYVGKYGPGHDRIFQEHLTTLREYIKELRETSNQESRPEGRPS